MKLLTRDAILAADDLKSEVVEVPEWSGSVKVRTMTGNERDALMSAMTGADGKFNPAGYRLRMLARCIVGADGQPVFGEADLQALGQKNPIVTDRIFEVADRLNSIGEAKIQEAEKNS